MHLGFYILVLHGLLQSSVCDVPPSAFQYDLRTTLRTPFAFIRTWTSLNWIAIAYNNHIQTKYQIMIYCIWLQHEHIPVKQLHLDVSGLPQISYRESLSSHVAPPVALIAWSCWYNESYRCDSCFQKALTRHFLLVLDCHTWPQARINSRPLLFRNLALTWADCNIYHNVFLAIML